ncbi:MAG: plastocyanin/azurin family copper-binding protein [Gemmatimonadales bacterium]|nr:plastocyanin/azurin family copper-binding protein [Gemmatimonadales bacterium]
MKRWSIAVLPVLALSAAAFVHPAERTPPPATVRVRMLQAGTQFKFEPAGIRINPGDIVEFVNVSGMPHNVQFYPNRIPAGAKDVLNRAMAQRMGDVAGPMMMQPNQVYRINFAGAPQGTYDYMCLPHQALGMKATIIVGQAGGPGSTINDGEPTPAQVPVRH